MTSFVFSSLRCIEIFLTKFVLEVILFSDKFKSLSYFEIDLDVDTQSEQSWVGLVDPTGLPQHHLLRKKDSHSRQRRRSRRNAETFAHN